MKWELWWNVPLGWQFLPWEKFSKAVSTSLLWNDSLPDVIGAGLQSIGPLSHPHLATGIIPERFRAWSYLLNWRIPPSSEGREGQEVCLDVAQLCLYLTRNKTIVWNVHLREIKKKKKNSSEIWKNATSHPKVFQTLRQLLNELKLQIRTNVLPRSPPPRITQYGF